MNNIFFNFLLLLPIVFLSKSCYFNNEKPYSQKNLHSNSNITIHIDQEKYSGFEGPNEESLQKLIETEKKPFRIEISRSFISQKSLAGKARIMISAKSNKDIILSYSSSKEKKSRQYQLQSCRPIELVFKTHNSHIGGFYEKVVFIFQEIYLL